MTSQKNDKNLNFDNIVSFSRNTWYNGTCDWSHKLNLYSWKNHCLEISGVMILKFLKAMVYAYKSPREKRQWLVALEAPEGWLELNL